MHVQKCLCKFCSRVSVFLETFTHNMHMCTYTSWSNMPEDRIVKIGSGVNVGVKITLSSYFGLKAVTVMLFSVRL